MRKIAVCKRCKSPNVFQDASSAWNVATQRWELVTNHESYNCEGCNAFTEIELVPVGHERGQHLVNPTTEVMKLRMVALVSGGILQDVIGDPCPYDVAIDFHLLDEDNEEVATDPTEVALYEEARKLREELAADPTNPSYF